MKAILVIDNISTDLNIEELRADIKVNCYGDVIAIYNNVSLKPMEEYDNLMKRIHRLEEEYFGESNISN